MRGWVCLFGLLALAGCSFSETIAQHAINYNKTVAQTDDAQTLLNILRARDRAPMHFTAIREVQGELEQSTGSSFSLTIPFGGDAASSFPFMPQVELNQRSNPMFTVDVLGNRQDFVNAVSKPIELEIVKTFWDQGWPPEFLLYVVVERIELRDKSDSDSNVAFSSPVFGSVFDEKCKKVGSRVENDPEQRDQLDCFSKIVAFLANPPAGLPGNPRLRLIDSFSGTPVGPAIKRSTFNSVDHLLKVREKGHTFISKGGAGDDELFQLCEVQDISTFCFSEMTCRMIPRDPIDACNRADAKALRTARDQRSGVYEVTVMIGGKEIVFSAHLRSLLGMLYYAGEILRDPKANRVWIGASDDQKLCQDIRGEPGDRQVPLFVVNEGDVGRAAVSVEHLGSNYWIPPGDKCNRSLQTLAFLNQVSGIYQSRADLPTSATIQTIAR